LANPKTNVKGQFFDIIKVMKNRAFPKTKKLIVSNWKMNPESLKEAKKLFGAIKKKNFNTKKLISVICPPYLFESDLALNYSGGKFKFGFQDIHFESDEKSTGEISTEMAKNSKVEYVILGHSERRENGETSEMVAEKIQKTIKAGLTPIVCVGEVERDEQGSYLRFIERQVFESVYGISKANLSKIVFVYEPVWAIGKGKSSMSSHEIHQMNIFIKKILVNLVGKKIAMNIPILYGGSVDADNAKEIVEMGEVDGLLVGRSSLNPHVFGDILNNLG
jgi:triosephosphate isomerase